MYLNGLGTVQPYDTGLSVSSQLIVKTLKQVTELVAKGLSLEDVRASLSIATVDNPKGDQRRGALIDDLYQTIS